MVDKLPNDPNSNVPPGHGSGANAPGVARRSGAHRNPDMRDAVAELAERAQLISQEAGTKVAAAMKDVISAGAGIAGFAIESARDLVQYMVKRGQMTPEEGDKLMREAEAAHEQRPASEKARPTASKLAAEKAATAKAEAAARAATQPPAPHPFRAAARPVVPPAGPAKAAPPAKSAAAKSSPSPVAKATPTAAPKAAAKGGVKEPAKPAKAAKPTAASPASPATSAKPPKTPAKSAAKAPAKAAKPAKKGGKR